MELKKRKWVYLQSPKCFEFAPCSCGNHDTQWSEYEKHLWCAQCEKDFIPEYNGVFDGPIPINIAQGLGLSFDRFNLETQKVEVISPIFNSDKIEYVECLSWKEALKQKNIPIIVTRKNNAQEKEVFSTFNAIMHLEENNFFVEINENVEQTNATYMMGLIIGYPKKEEFILSLTDEGNHQFKIKSDSQLKELEKSFLYQKLQYQLPDKQNDIKKARFDYQNFAYDVNFQLI